MHQRIRPGLFVVLWALSAVACRPAPLTYRVIDEGTPITVEGRFATVGELLAAAGVAPAAEGDLLPALNAPADPATPVAIDRAAEVTVITPDGVTTWRTQAQTLGAFLAEQRLAPPPGSRLLADGEPVAIEAAAGMPLPADIIFDPWKRVIVTDGNQRRALRTTALTVGEALAEAEIALGALDNVEPPREAALVPEMAILIERAAPYVVVADGHTVSIQSDSTQVFDILADNGIALGSLDYTRPAAGAAVAPGDTIEVVRVAERIDTVEEAVPFETVFEAAPDLEIDTLIEAAPGGNGVLQRLTRVRLENGVEVSSESGGESLLVAPVNRVLRYGTNIIMRTIDTPEGPVEYWRKVTMRVTSYTATSAGKKPGEPGYGITASGVQAGTGVIAVDPKVIPFRSYVYVPGYGVAFAGDTGGGIKGRFVDLGYDEDEFQSWRGTVDVYYLGPPPPAEEIRWILP